MAETLARRALPSFTTRRLSKRTSILFLPTKDGSTTKQNRGFNRSYSLAIARRVPKSFPNALTMSNGDGGGSHDSSSSIDYHKATIEHENYLQALRKHVPVLCLPALDDLPDSIFVEDTVVAIGNKAVITRPGHPSRRPEVDSIRQVLGEMLGMDVTDMRQMNDHAVCDGGDVLYTGRHLFVGVSGDRTNEQALEVLQEGLGVEVIPIPFRQSLGALHLKSILTHMNDRSMVVPDTDVGHRVFQMIADATNGAYSRSDAVWLPAHAGLSCNVVSVSSGVLAQLVHESDTETKARLTEAAHERDLPIEFVAQGEAAKCDGALTCCSVLLDI